MNGDMGIRRAIDEFLALAYHKKFGLGVTVGRFFNVVGPRQVGNYGMVLPRFVESALRGGPVIVYDDGSQVRCFAHVREITQCISKLMATESAEGRVFNIGSDQPVSILELAKRVMSKCSSFRTLKLTAKTSKMFSVAFPTSLDCTKPSVRSR